MDYGHITLGPNYFYINVHLAIVSVILVIVISVNMIASPYTLLIMRVYSVTVIEKVRIVTILYSVCTGISFKQRYIRSCIIWADYVYNSYITWAICIIQKGGPQHMVNIVIYDCTT